MVAAELTGDGHLDLVLAQNFYQPQIETGRMDGGVSLLLSGKGDGTFDAVPPRESGLVVNGDAVAVTTADLNGDGLLDLVFSRNGDTPVAFLRTGR